MSVETKSVDTDTKFWTTAIDTVVELLRALLVDTHDEEIRTLAELWSRVDLTPVSGQNGHSIDRLGAHIDADQTQRRVMILAVVAALAPDRVEPLLGRRHECSRFSLTVGDVLAILGLNNPLERVKSLQVFRQRSVLARAKLVEVSFGFEPETVVDLLDARVAATYLLVDTVFGLRPVEAVVIPDEQPAEHPERDA